MNRERIPELCKTLRHEASEIKVRKLMNLDRSDRVLIERKLEEVINLMIRIQTIGDAQCSCVLELYESLGGQVRTV